MKHSTQNYLKAIYQLSELDGKTTVKVNDLAKKLSISMPAVSEMMKRLESDGYVKIKPYKGVSLTAKGKDLGVTMVRHHRIWETYLWSVLGFTWDEVHDEAELLEHASSNKVIDRLESLMDYPQFDPHGNPIPDSKGHLPVIKNEQLLSTCIVGDSCSIVRFVDLDSSYLTFLLQHGIAPNSKLKITDILAFDGTLVCDINGQSFHFSSQAANQIFVILK